jgi:hypothetical protein
MNPGQPSSQQATRALQKCTSSQSEHTITHKPFQETTISIIMAGNLVIHLVNTRSCIL